MAVNLSDLVTQEAERLEAETEEEFWTCVRIWTTSQANGDQSIGVAFMGIFRDPESAKARAVDSNHGSITWIHYEKAERYQGNPRPAGNESSIFYVVQRDKRL